MSVKKETKTERFTLVALMTLNQKQKFDDPKFKAKLNKIAVERGFKKWNDSQFVIAVMDKLRKNPAEFLDSIDYAKVD